MIASIHDPPVTAAVASAATGPAAWAQALPGHISPTAAKAYLGCSLRFWFERVVCIRKATPVALHLGKAVHAALQAFHLARWRGEDSSVERMDLVFEACWIHGCEEEAMIWNSADEEAKEKAAAEAKAAEAARLAGVV